MIALHGTLLRARRLEVGVTVAGLAKTAGLPAQTIRTIEDGGTPANVTLESLDAICRTLAVTPHRLLLPNTNDDTTTDHAAGDDTDASTVGAILAAQPLGAVPGRVAAALGWTPERVHAALRDLQTKLPATGTRLVTDHDRRRVVPADNPRARVAATTLAAEHQARAGVARDESQYICRAIAGTLIGRNIPTGKLPLLGRLLNAGHLAEPQTDDVYQPGPGVRDAITPTRPLPARGNTAIPAPTRPAEKPVTLTFRSDPETRHH